MATLKHIKIAEELASVRSEIDELTATVIDPLKAKEVELKEKLLVELKKLGLKSLPLEGVGTFSRVARSNLEITDMVKAYEWANKQAEEGVEGVFKLDMTVIAKAIKPLLETPAGFALTETESITVNKPKDV